MGFSPTTWEDYRVRFTDQEIGLISDIPLPTRYLSLPLRDVFDTGGTGTLDDRKNSDRRSLIRRNHEEAFLEITLSGVFTLAAGLQMDTSDAVG